MPNHPQRAERLRHRAVEVPHRPESLPHALFDAGYITIDDDLRVVVSRRLHDDYGNGKDYYPYHGRRLSVVPERASYRPAKEYLNWHHDHVFFE